MPPAENGIFELLLPPSPFSAATVEVKDDALKEDALATAVLNMGARLILLKESTMDPSAMVNVGAEWDGCLEDGENSEEQPDISCERDESHARIGINGKLPPQPQDSQPPMRYR